MATISENSNDNSTVHSKGKTWDDQWLYDTSIDEIFGSIENMRFPLKYMASLFGAGDEKLMAEKLKKLMAIRIYRRKETR
jgi:nitrate reductase beta subunit